MIKIIDKIIKLVRAVSMLIMVSVTFYQVVMRYAFNSSPSWTEEFVRYMFVWVSMLGASIGIKEHIHIGVDAVVNLLPTKGRLFVQFLVHFIVIAFCIFLIRYTFPVLKVTSIQRSPALHLKVSYEYAAVLAFGFLGVFYSIREVIILAIANFKKAGKEESEK